MWFFYIDKFLYCREKKDQEHRERERLEKERSDRERKDKEARERNDRQAAEDVNRHFQLSMEMVRKVMQNSAFCLKWWWYKNEWEWLKECFGSIFNGNDLKGR